MKALGARSVRLARSYVELHVLSTALKSALDASSVDLDVRVRGVKYPAPPAVSRRVALRVFLDKLYELYVLYVILKALQRLGEVRKEDSIIFVRLNGNGIRVFYNSRPRANGAPISRVALGDSDSLDRGDLERISGVPDITLVVNGRVKVVVEVKHSRNVGYLTLARLKTMAYVDEYDADAGVLVYPGIRLKEDSSIIDEEYAATRTLLSRAEARGFVRIRLRDDAALYVAPLRPCMRYEDKNIERMYRIISDVIDHGQRNG